jgi:major vault protein
MVRVVQGHHLRSNQYLVVRVYDEEAAKANWKDAVFKPQRGRRRRGPRPRSRPSPDDLTMGKLMVIKGTEVSFYIPPTGIEVVPTSGQLRARGRHAGAPGVLHPARRGRQQALHPRPGGGVPAADGDLRRARRARKFRAIELNENSGIYVKVIAPYEDGRARVQGRRRALHHRPRADDLLPAPRARGGQVRRARDPLRHRDPRGRGALRARPQRTGQISLRRGPAIFLPDPRREVIVRRVLTPRTVALWFPGNPRRWRSTSSSRQLKRAQGEGRAPRRPPPAEQHRRARAAAAGGREGGELVRGRRFQRSSQTFTRPRTIVLDTKYDGAVSIDGVDRLRGDGGEPHGRAQGDRRAPHAPHGVRRDACSRWSCRRARPRATSGSFRTVYLRTLNNKVSDAVEAETRDLCRCTCSCRTG